MSLSCSRSSIVMYRLFFHENNSGLAECAFSTRLVITVLFPCFEYPPNVAFIIEDRVVLPLLPVCVEFTPV